jgi:polyhydroxyalkanoate synthesis regulator phasin
MMEEHQQHHSADGASRPLYLFETAEAAFCKVKNAFQQSRGRKIGRRFYDTARVDPVGALQQLREEGKELGQEVLDQVGEHTDAFVDKTRALFGDACEAPADTGRSLLSKGADRMDAWAQSASRQGKETLEGLQDDMRRIRESLMTVGKKPPRPHGCDRATLEKRLDNLLERLGRRMNLADKNEMKALKEAVEALEDKVERLLNRPKE